MIELLAGMVGGVGLFIVGMWLLTENMKTMVNRRLRMAASRWTSNRISAVLWGTLAGCVTQSMSACTFVVVSILRSGLITTKGALALILGGCVGVSVRWWSSASMLGWLRSTLSASPVQSWSVTGCRESDPWLRLVSVEP